MKASRDASEASKQGLNSLGDYRNKTAVASEDVMLAVAFTVTVQSDKVAITTAPLLHSRVNGVISKWGGFMNSIGIIFGVFFVHKYYWETSDGGKAPTPIPRTEELTMRIVGSRVGMGRKEAEEQGLVTDGLE